MNKRELNLRIFDNQEVSEILFQPRIEMWYNWNKSRGTLPERYKNMSLLQVYDDLDISVRYIYGYWPYNRGGTYFKQVKIDVKEQKDKRINVINTPRGRLITEYRLSSDKAWIVTKFPIKKIEDIEKAIWFYENLTFTFEKDKFEQASEYFGDRGFPQFYLPRSPYQSLSTNGFTPSMGMENLIYALNDYPDQVEKLMQAIDHSQDTLYEDIISYGKTKLINFGENVDANLVSPYYFEKYCVPYYEKRVNQLKEAGIYAYIHIDGSFKPLLKHLNNLPFRGLEALTPIPQGDVTIEEIKESIGDKILLDGIPAIFFLPNYPLEKLEQCARKLINLFHPRLVLGASDELPPEADIERIRYISQYCKNFKRGD